jgi:hypothetical protein
MNKSAHRGRSFTGYDLEDNCPCIKEPCGLVDLEKANEKCSEHAFGSSKTMRQGHYADKCPGVKL